MRTDLRTDPWNDTAVAYPGEPCLHELVHAQARRTPDALAVVAEPDRLTYAELVARANQLAHLLVARGIGPESRVGVCLHRGTDMVVALLGILTAGAAYVPLDPEYPAQRIAFMVADAQLGTVVTDLDLPGDIVAVRRDTPAAPTGAPGVRTDVDNAAYVIYTSGSTGNPKGVVMAHRGIVNRVRWGLATHPLDVTDRVLQKTPYSFDVSVPEFFATLAAGARLVMARPGGHRDPAYLVDVINEHGITSVHFVPSMLRAFLAEVRDARADLPSLRRIVCSGEALPADLVHGVDELLGCEVLNLYGPTETAVEVTGMRCRPGEPVNIGHAVANCQTHILDDDSERVEIGELCLAGVQLARGYLHQPALTAQRFVPNPFGPPGSRLYRSGDLARRLPDGAVDYLGRIDHQVKIRGHRVELGEIESVLRDVAGVRAAAATVHNDQIIGYVVSAVAPSTRQLRADLGQRLPEYMIPSVFMTLSALPLSPSGKLDRAALPAPDGRRLSDVDYVAPRDDNERQLADIWAEMLDVRPVGIRDTFVELGGDSLAATRVCSRARRSFGWSLSPADVLASTVAELVERATRPTDATRPTGATATATGVAADPRQLSAAQRRLWFLDQLSSGSSAYNMFESYRLHGPVEVDVLREALSDTVHRHPALRTTFRAERGIPYAHVSDSVDIPVEVRQVTDEADADAVTERLVAAPFVLADGPLLRVTLLRLAPEEHILLGVIHHIVADDWSMDVLWRDLRVAYEHRQRGEPLTVDPLPSALVSQPDPADLAYWLEHLAGAPATLDLPTDGPRPARLRYADTTVRFTLPVEVTTEVRGLARSAGSTPFMLLLAAFSVLVAELAGRTDLVVGTFAGNRGSVEAEDGIGMFVNTLALRVRCPDDPTFVELLRQVRQVALAGYRHQELPFDHLVTALRPKRDLSRNPVVQVAFQLLGDLTGRLRLPGTVTQPFRHGQGGIPFDLLLTIREVGDELTGWLHYNADLFTAGRAGSFADLFVRIVRAAVGHPDRRISELSGVPAGTPAENAGAVAGNVGDADR